MCSLFESFSSNYSFCRSKSPKYKQVFEGLEGILKRKGCKGLREKYSCRRRLKELLLVIEEKPTRKKKSLKNSICKELKVYAYIIKYWK